MNGSKSGDAAMTWSLSLRYWPHGSITAARRGLRVLWWRRNLPGGSTALSGGGCGCQVIGPGGCGVVDTRSGC